MTNSFGFLPSGEKAQLYTISGGEIRASITDLGATLVSVWVPDTSGNTADVVLGYDDASGYLKNAGFLGAVVGRNANRVRGAQFDMNGVTVKLTANEGKNSLHSGPDCWNTRLWKVEEQRENAIRLSLNSPDGDQGFPGNAKVEVTYSIENNALMVTYDAVSDKDTVFNLTNHAYFNLAGQERTDKAMAQVLQMPETHFNPDDAENIPTGETRSVEGTPFDFRSPKALSRDIEEDYEPLILQGGYDHNFIVNAIPCAVLTDPESGRKMEVSTDCPGVQIYTANFLDVTGKGGVHYGKRSGVCLETQFCPNSVNHPEWPQPFVKAGEKYHSVTKFGFSW